MERKNYKEYDDYDEEEGGRIRPSRSYLRCY